jgi:hypothetical protein
MPEACKLDSSSHADREISSPPPAVPAPVPRSRPPLGIGPAVGTALPRGGEEHQGLPCFHASMLVCLSACLLVFFHASTQHASLLPASLLPSSTLASPNASMLPCCHVPVAPLPWFCGRLPFPHPLLNPSSFLYPSVFRTRTHERPRLRPTALSPYLGQMFRVGFTLSQSHKRHPLHRSRAAEGSGIQMKNMPRDPRVSSPFCDK